jgi:hypothetical protein
MMLQKIGLKPQSSFALALALGAAILSQPSMAAKPFDGDWSVRITAQRGSCSGYTVPIEVSGGRVSYSGFFDATATGSVRPNGAIKVRFAHEDQVVDASGSVRGQTGSGRWTSPTKGCAGTWTARRG